jgi:hypothetical protein
MKNPFLLVLTVCCIAIVFSDCKGKEKKPEGKSFISAQSFINGQLKDIDTSLYAIVKVNYRDSITSDTEYIRRENIRVVAKDFLDIADLSSDRFTEENIPGPTEGLTTVSYKPIEPTKEEIQRMDFIIDPDLAPQGKSVVKTIYIEKGISNRDSSVQKKMLWQVDKSFQVTTTRQLPGQPEINSTFRVSWNGDEDNP